MQIRVSAIYRYPVKGLSPEPVERALLSPGENLPQDRRFALARASTVFDPTHPEWLPKTSFFMLMRDEKLARLRTRFDERSGDLTIERIGQVALRARLTDATGRDRANAFFTEFLKDAPGGPPRLVEAPGHTFSDAKRKPGSTTHQYISLASLSSIGALEQAAQVSVDPLRFRANLYLAGAPAWAELDWIGSEIMAGTARLRVIASTTRCAATAVNPVTAQRDLDIPGMLQEKFGHNCMGVYAEVVGGGEIVKGDGIDPI